ncbi:hypothetical protein AWC38_SpisGene16508 [Stylophora pistillata]|uniref:EGF-like domain-containing protein n=1 Tax=Stylophora pistillata TaxID=50429 RepID=A0A2B4RN83_STYPI|nr:hypothetical protein AWC38_SpisGene16508 [Stylophora pistillata]
MAFVGNSTLTKIVKDYFDCSFFCLESGPSACLSFNLGRNSESGYRRCELINSERYMEPERIEEHKSYDYYGTTPASLFRLLPCMSNPCNNGGICILGRKMGGFSCQCVIQISVLPFIDDLCSIVKCCFIPSLLSVTIGRFWSAHLDVCSPVVSSPVVSALDSSLNDTEEIEIMILPKLALSVMNDSLESIARFADADTLKRIVDRVDLYLQDAEGPLSDYETRDIVEKRNEIFKAMLEYTKAVVERELSDDMETDQERNEWLKKEKKEQEYEDLLWELHKDKTMEVEDNSPGEFCLTLPSNDASKKYYPENPNRSWKNRLDRTIRLEGTWQVGLSSLSVPTRKIGESNGDLQKYLETLQDSDVLLSTSRITLSPTERQVMIKHSVTHGDIKFYKLDTSFDVLEALLKEEYLHFTHHRPPHLREYFSNGEKAQFDTIVDRQRGTIEIDPINIDRDQITDFTIRRQVYIELAKGLCEVSGWTRRSQVTGTGVSGQSIVNDNVTRPGPNLDVRKTGTQWTIDKSYDTVVLLDETYDIPFVDRNNPVTHRFLMSDIAWTFLQVNRSSDHVPSENRVYRSLYVYSSLIDLVLMGDQTADLLRQVPLEEVEKGTYYFHPSQIQYIELRNNQIQVVETQLSETLTNELADISEEGASILTLHFKKVKQ